MKREARRRISQFAACTLLGATTVATGVALFASPAAVGAGAAPGDSSKRMTAPNPHWTEDGCVVCHGPRAEGSMRMDRATVDEMCLKCHDGMLASAEVHPMGRPVTGPQTVLPAGWPANDNRLSCLTCHDVLPGCRTDARRPPTNPALLRGDLLGGLDRFCAKCHVATPHGLDTPHVMVTAGGTVDGHACRRCHDATLDPVKAALQKSHTGEARLRSDEVTLCGSCHTRHEDWFSPGHIGARPSEEILKNMAVSDLPPGRDGTVVCSTCHNPHQRGLFAENSLLGRGARDANATTRTFALRLERGSICAACHP